jgi:hypothetical protein
LKIKALASFHLSPRGANTGTFLWSVFVNGTEKEQLTLPQGEENNEI